MAKAKLIRCELGHVFDSAANSRCPDCELLEAKLAAAKAASDEAGTQASESGGAYHGRNLAAATVLGIPLLWFGGAAVAAVAVTVGFVALRSMPAPTPTEHSEPAQKTQPSSQAAVPPKQMPAEPKQPSADAKQPDAERKQAAVQPSQQQSSPSADISPQQGIRPADVPALPPPPSSQSALVVPPVQPLPAPTPLPVQPLPPSNPTPIPAPSVAPNPPPQQNTSPMIFDPSVITRDKIGYTGTGWGALAYSSKTRNFGESWGYRNAEQAKARALSECGGAEAGCSVGVWYQRRCGAVAVGENGRWAGGLGDTMEGAVRDAMIDCGRNGGLTCRLHQVNCTR